VVDEAQTDRGSGKAIAPFVLGVITVIGYVVISICDYLHTH
jgi:hypothetical protein